MVSFRPWMATFFLFYSPIVGLFKLITWVARFFIISVELVIIDTILLILTLVAVVAAPFAIIHGLASVITFTDATTLDITGRKKPNFFFGLRYNRRVGLTLRLQRVTLSYPRCITITSNVYTMWNGSNLILPEVIEEGQIRKMILNPENAALQTRDRFIWRLTAERDRRTRFSRRGMKNEMTCTFEFSMARGRYKSSITETIELFHPIPLP